MEEQNGGNVRTPKRISRRSLLAALGGAGVVVAGQSFIKEGVMGDSVNSATYGFGQDMGNFPFNMFRFRYVESVAKMKSETALKEGMIVRTAGYYEPGDGGGADYIVKQGTLAEDLGSVVNLNGGLQSVLLAEDSINYKQFGAVGDGVNDDGIQIKRAHDYANAHDLPVINGTGEYWIKATNEIVVQTNVNWGHTKFHIDEGFNSKSNPRFRVTSRKNTVNITFDAAVKASFLAKMKPGTTFVPELAPYKNCLIFITDSNDKIGVRQGYNHSGWNKEEFFYVEEHGRLIGDIAWTFNDYTSLVAYPCDDNYLIIDGGTFYVSGNSPGAGGAYLHNGILVRRSRTIIRNQWVGLEAGASDTSMDPRHGFYYFNYVFDVTLENVRLIPWEQDREGTDRDVPAGTYGIGGARVLNALFHNVTSEGGMIHWGVFGTNLFKNFSIERCRLNRVDVHFHCWNLYVKDSEIGYRGFTLTGGGDLFIENTKRFGARFIDFRVDYGAKWDGSIRLTKCRLVVTNGSAEAVALHCVPANFDYKYPIGYGRSIKVEDFVFDYTGIPNPTGICRIMKIAAFSKITSTSERLFFPNSIEFRDISVVGREKGVRMLEIPNPLSFNLGKPGGYDANRITTNCHMRFINIQSEKVPPQTSQSTTHVNFLLNALATAPYDDSYALYPKIEFLNCGEFFGHFKGSVADVYFNGCSVNCLDAYEGGRMRGRIVFDNCHLKADSVDDGKLLYSTAVEHGVSFLNCTIHAPVLDGASRPDLLSRYDFIDVNNKLLHNHLNTSLSKEIVDHYAGTGKPVAPEFYAMLKSHHASESTLMARRKGPTASRPAPAAFQSEPGFAYFDEDLNRIVVWDGTRWVKADKEKRTLHFYLDQLSNANPGAAFKREGNHPSQTYVMPGSGKLLRYLIHFHSSNAAGAFVFEVWKNGAVWISGMASPSPSLKPRSELFASDAAFEEGDIVGIRLASVSAGLPADAYATLDLFAEYEE